MKHTSKPVNLAGQVMSTNSAVEVDESKRAGGMVDFAITLEADSYVPFYEQIVGQVRNAIRIGRLVPGAGFYSEGEISRSLGISKMPVRQAFQKLRDEGLLIIRQGKRPIIGAERVPWDFQRLRGFSEEMLRKGLTPSARVLSMVEEVADATVASALRLTPEQKVYRLKRLRFIDRQPVAVVTSYLPAHIFPGIDQLDLANQSLYHIIERLYARPLQRADEVIGARNAEPEEASVLQTSSGSALLIITETTYDVQQVPVEYSVSLLRGDRYTAFVTSVRKG
jgi:GntR family transcriptional regulator